MRGVANGTFLVAVAAIAALFVGGIEGGHVTFANKGTNVQTDTNQDQGCEPAGGTSGITNACTATSGRGSTQTSVTLSFGHCSIVVGVGPTTCDMVISCNNIGCQSVTCATGNPLGAPFNCTTNNGVQLTSCTFVAVPGDGVNLPCTLTETGTGITNSGGVTGNDAG
jgi:hypothetical protein